MTTQRERFLRWFQRRYPDEVDLTCEQALGLSGDQRFLNPRCAIAWAAWQDAWQEATAPVVGGDSGMTTMIEVREPITTEHSKREPPLRFTFGKYKGRRMEEVLKENPQYFAWCYGNVANHGIPHEMLVRAGVQPTPASMPSRPQSDHADDFADDDIPF